MKLLRGAYLAASLFAQEPLTQIGLVASPRPASGAVPPQLRDPEVAPAANSPVAVSAAINVQAYGAKPDGRTDSTAAFRAALAAATARGGGIVTVPAGPSFYTITSPVQIPSKVELRCDNFAELKNTVLHGSVIQFAANTTKAGIVGCKVTGPGATLPVSAGDGSPIGIFGPSEYIRVVNNEISNHEFAGLYITGTSSSFLNVTDNYIHNGYDSSAYTGGTNQGDIVIWTNAITDSNFLRNRCTSSNDWGIGLIISSGTATRNVFAENSIQGHHYYGIMLYNNGATAVKNNTVSRNQILNTFSRTNGVAIMSYGAGIYLNQTDENLVEDNYVENALIGRTDTTLPRGAISVNFGKRNAFNGNIVVGSHYHGYHCSTCVGAIFSNNVANASSHSGVLINAGSDNSWIGGHINGTANSESGLTVNGSLRTMVESVEVTGATYYGIEVDVNSDGTRVDGTTSYSNTVGGYTIASGNVQITNNWAFDNSNVGFNLNAAGALSNVVFIGNIANSPGAVQQCGILEQTGKYRNVLLMNNISTGNSLLNWSVLTTSYTASGNTNFADKATAKTSPSLLGQENWQNRRLVAAKARAAILTISPSHFLWPLGNPPAESSAHERTGRVRHRFRAHVLWRSEHYSIN